MPLVSVSQRKEDGTPLLGIGEEMILALPGVECHFDPSGPSEGPGSLYVTTKNVIWLSSQVCHSLLPIVVLPPSRRVVRDLITICQLICVWWCWW